MELGLKLGRPRSGLAMATVVAALAVAVHASWDARPANADTPVPISPTVTPDDGGQPTYPAPPPTAFITPTPGANGTIIYVVQPGDTLWRIASIAGVSIDQIRSLNGLTSDLISVGQRLILVKGAASTPGANAPPAATSTDAANPPPTASDNQAPSTNRSLAATGTVCALLWNDADGDGVRDAGEGLLAGGQLSVIEIATSRPVRAYTTDGSNEPHCFNDLPAGQYTVSALAPAGYTATTVRSVPLEVAAGSVSTLEFGAQQHTALPEQSRPQAGGQPVMTGLVFTGSAILALLVLLMTGAAAFLFWRRRR